MVLFTVPPRSYRRQDACTQAGLCAISALNRINALSCIMSARHGWLGASYSVAELLSVLYFGLQQRNIVLSKGHAAAMQYASLHGLGLLDRAQLLSYKDGADSLQAHSDPTAPTVLTSTGSLGQALSRTAGLAWARPEERFFVVLGDGELQEGQVWEALQTVSHMGLNNLCAIVDRNGFQSERRVASIKAIPDLRAVAEGFGLRVRCVDGHDPMALRQELAEETARPRLLIADTVKAGGSRFLSADGDRQPWHGRVPDERLYLEILQEQAQLAGEGERFERYRRGVAPARPRPSAGMRTLSTRDAFGRSLEALLDERSELVALDADLAGSCGLGAIADPAGRFARRGQFLQLGIAEQDMVSFAGGLAVAGRLPVVNTYAAFLKRALEQVHGNSCEGRRIIYAGHYAGLCYFSDGRSHQSLDDLALMAASGLLQLLEPVTPRQTGRMLRWAVQRCPRAVYLRLRRTPAPLAAQLKDAGPFDADDPLHPLVSGRRSRRCFVAAGAVASTLALECMALPEFEDWGLLVQCAWGHDPDTRPYGELWENAEELLLIEESPPPGVLRPFVEGLLRRLALRPRLRCLQAEGLGASFRSLEACRAHFGFTVEGVRALRAES